MPALRRGGDRFRAAQKLALDKGQELLKYQHG
jgi:hypothetical protein